MSAQKRTGVVTAEEIMQSPQWLIVDCSHDPVDSSIGMRQYEAEHIPGALFVHVDDVLAGFRTGRNGRHPLPAPEDIAATLSRYGVSSETQVVAYDRSGGLFASRFWWTLRWLGHDAVAVLDGGISQWKARGGELTDEVPASRPTTFVPKPNDAMRVSADDVMNALVDGKTLLVDARSASRFAGIGETLDPRGGHIPGAINRPYTENLTADGTFKPAAQLREEWKELLGVGNWETLVSTCGSGISACHNLLSLEVAGIYGGAKLYPGSWSEWCASPDRPLEVGG